MATEGDQMIYGSVMFLILTIGLVGNILTIVILLRKDYRSKLIVPYMLNMAVLDALLILFGYPVSINAILTGRRLKPEDRTCKFDAFMNGSIGISAIITLTYISFIMYRTITNTTTMPRQISAVYLFGSLCAIWTYGVLTMLPPLVGWSKFVPGAAGFSCAPDWGSASASTLSYNIVLMVLGFVIPVGVISVCYYKIFRFLCFNPVPTAFASIRNNRRRVNVRITRMIMVSIISFVISWSPYCVVSVMAMVHRAPSLPRGFAEIPELMAKASVIYNPLVFTVMNIEFRRSLFQVMSNFRCKGDTGVSALQRNSVAPGDIRCG
ncbi:melanopsin-like [Nematostella vectensis]|uniref:melanopsin-like n=1 Tax=Nematostella vectensis TaxID=45351 RepID=UPI0020773F61|nr:melanopsin-like [Nematostella vectensis]XP_048577142.1 melanopsin-like [Nematostella vectensis]